VTSGEEAAEGDTLRVAKATRHLRCLGHRAAIYVASHCN
jgi:hypothetical protein